MAPELSMPTAERRDLSVVHPEMPTRVDAWLEARGCSWRQLLAGQLTLPAPPGMGGLTQLQILQWWLIQSDPVLFTETMMVEKPENGGCRWRLWDYQKSSLRYRGDACNSSASAVGKTRELEILVLWNLVFQPGSIVVVSSQDGMVEEILADLEYQFEQNPWLGSQIRSITRRPRRVIKAVNGNRATFLPIGVNGEPLRGQHPSRLLVGDECDKWWDPEQWNEFWRAPEPSCEKRLYSVLSGRRGTVFARIREAAVPLEDVIEGRVSIKSRKRRRGESLGSEIRWVLVHWKRTDRPDWDEAQRRKMIEQYGGEHTSGYQRNVLGLPGEPEEAVFNRGDLKICRRTSLTYTLIEITVDRNRGVVTASARRADPTYSGSSNAESLIVEAKLETTIGQFDLDGFLEAHLDLPDGAYALGADFGQSPDPTEIAVVRAEAERSLFAARISLRGVAYHEQGRLLGLTIQRLVRPRLGWGVDSTGVGTAVEQHLRSHLENPFDLSGYVWNRVVPLRDEYGDVLQDEQGRERTVSTKELATQILEGLVERHDLTLPHDAEVTRQLENHNATIGVSGKRQFDHTDDHIIDALRAAALRRFDLEYGLELTPPPLDAVTSIESPRRGVGDLGGFGGGFELGPPPEPPARPTSLTPSGVWL